MNQMPKQPDHLDAYIDAAAQALGLPVAPEAQYTRDLLAAIPHPTFA